MSASQVNWKMSCTPDVLIKRAQIMKQIRAFFDERDILEVDTPILSQAAATDPNLDSFQTTLKPDNKTYYLQTSPEFAMKRLLAQGVGSIYQIAKVFRNGERSPKHNPEFTLLEWYRPGLDYHQLMAEVETLLSLILKPKATVKLSYQQCFKEYCQLDPFEVSLESLHDCIRQHVNVDLQAYRDIDDCYHLLMTHVIEPKLPTDSLVFVYDYPASQAMLAQLNNQGLAQRFEVYYNGLELANGFQELTDRDEQFQRFKQDLSERQQRQLERVPMDRALLGALDTLPFCSGVAVGLERLICAVLHSNISQILCFPIELA